MGIMLTATFDTRRDAEMTVERLVQEFDVDRTAISIASEGDANTAGDLLAGSDTAADQPGQDDRDDAPLQGAIVVTAEVENEEAAELVRAAFSEFDAAGVVETE
ncbi:hypothetical protein [Sphingomonas immobilis]|uniref:Uncharacterized protein n=1 Tax=Sphingomonas immobilis TaxID=3063997 RepID=A0ABT8ZX74_9SPHN|nr:hypothetical protein [Sphingomonas sp. CA1-15]MDO7841893.1 hypothetical protein [Sphingomonas sp. CA1-15]